MRSARLRESALVEKIAPTVEWGGDAGKQGAVPMLSSFSHSSPLGKGQVAPPIEEEARGQLFETIAAICLTAISRTSLRAWPVPLATS